MLINSPVIAYNALASSALMLENGVISGSYIDALTLTTPVVLGAILLPSIVNPNVLGL